jgi:hypothetical protein
MLAGWNWSLQRDAFSAVMASQGIRTRAGLDKALSDVSEFLRTVPSDSYFRGEHDFDVGELWLRGGPSPPREHQGTCTVLGQQCISHTYCSPLPPARRLTAHYCSQLLPLQLRQPAFHARGVSHRGDPKSRTRCPLSFFLGFQRVSVCCVFVTLAQPMPDMGWPWKPSPFRMFLLSS